MKKIDKIEILENGVLQIREIELLELKDGSTVSGGYHRYCLTPDINIESISDSKIKSIALVTWTQDIISNYKNSIKDI